MRDDRHVAAVIDRSAGRTFPMTDAYSFHIDGEWRDASPQSIRKSSRVAQAATASRCAASGNNDRLSTLWREVISLASVARSFSKSMVQSISGSRLVAEQRHRGAIATFEVLWRRK